MLGFQTDGFLNRVTEALGRPIPNRCADLTILFDRATFKDLHGVFPLLIDNIFGPQSTVSWELRTISNQRNVHEFQALQHFFSPHGAFFKLIYTLLRDPLIKYDFSLAFVPTRVKQNLESSPRHPFYADLVREDPHTNRVISLLLNPFDYYFFHFAYHLINPWHKNSLLLTSPSWSTVYYSLCCDYLLHYLPTDPLTPVLPILQTFNAKTPSYTIPSLNSSVQLSKSSNNFDSFNAIKEMEQHPRNEIWRSETVMTIFVDMWLHNDQVFQSQTFDLPYATIDQKLPMNELPSGEYVRIVRALVKQMHAFAASSKMDDTHLAQLKKIATPYIQGRMYVFLRHLVHRWPLDGSFRLVLELWLSFIQPWRYSTPIYLKPRNDYDNHEAEENVTKTVVGGDYMPFIADNLLCYTVLLQQLIPRFTRVDIASPKISLILYRLTKVFAQPNLCKFLQEIESQTDLSSSPSHSYKNAHSSLLLPPLAPTTNWSSNTSSQLTPSGTTTQFFDNYRKTTGKWTAIVRQRILELEGPNFSYKPIFCAPTAPEVYDLLWHIKKSEQVALSIIQNRMIEENQMGFGFFHLMKSMFTMNETSDEFTLEERKKVPTYLQGALNYLTDIFHISDMSNASQQDTQTSQLPKVDFQNNLQFLLTPEKVRERIKTIKYEGDPELHPIRSDENRFLVRLLYQLATKINQEFQPKFTNTYYQENFLGRLSREFLQPPQTVYEYDKSLPGSPRRPKYIPPRISFRYAGSHRFLLGILFAIICSKLIGWEAFTIVYFTLIAWLLWKFTAAALKTTRGNNRTPSNASGQRESLFNSSFNESF